MTLSFPPDHRYTVDEYLALEAKSPHDKYEYREGSIVNLHEALAMAGGTANHSLIVMNTGIALGTRLRDGKCRVYDSNLRVRISRKVLWAYPDLTVICGDRELDTESPGETVLNPRAIVEVLSPSTENYDRNRKFDLYREISSLREYVLIWQNEARVQTFFRRDDGGWSFDAFAGLDAVAKLLSLKIDLPLSEVYANVELPPQPPEPESGVV